ncbi:MAG: cation-translocating P-type ATPase, partial [Actinomycetota bacterium]|nr:cation-translocating P-type ATPase [Actinomycetota bacterium]
ANEAALTGESIPVTKSIDPTLADASLGDRTSMVYAGTTIVAGRGMAMVVETGSDTEMGKIAALFSDDEPITPLQVELGRVGRRLGIIALAAAVLIFGAGLIRSFPIETMALTAVALAVAAIPEGLPAVVTVSLAGGLQRMAQRNAIVRRLPAVETLGAVDVICTDKTGTLTAPELKVGTVILGDGRSGTSLLGEHDQVVETLVVTAALCNDATASTNGASGDPTETALLDALVVAGIDVEEVRNAAPRIDEGGFDGRRKRMSTVHESGSGYVLYVKGAPEVLLERSSLVMTESGFQTLDQALHESIHQAANEIASNGMRTLAFAFKTLAFRPSDPALEETELTFIGLVGLNERIRDEVPDSISKARDAGVNTVMVTGDHATTAAAVADAVGLVEGEVMGGKDLAAITTEDLESEIASYRVFARVDPADKVKIIESWQQAGSTVAMTGDGVNDAPALHRADIGVAMGSGTDVARESAAMVLADDNYSTIVSAIAEGRRIFSNLRNVVHYLLSANASEVLYVLTGFLIFGYLGEPLLAIQLLWINLLSDAMPAIALGMDIPARDLMQDRPGSGRDVLSARNAALLITQGTILATAALAAMLVGTYSLDLDHETVRTMVFSTLVFSQLLHALSVRAGSGPMRRPGRLLVASLFVSAVLQFFVVYTSLGSDVFHTRPLSLSAMIWVIVVSIGSMGLVRLLNVTLGRRERVEV